jgi:tetratricopeptide (TPR) repeat protein
VRDVGGRGWSELIRFSKTWKLLLGLPAIVLQGAMSLGCAAPVVGQTGAGVRGVVQDAAGTPVAGATVLLRRKGADAAVAEATTASDGSFVFSSPAAGDYVVSAHKDATRSGDLAVAVGPDGAQATAKTIVLKLAPALGSQAMEFSDAPSFAIAAVTDWTAAGGHGSDAILRTSESLTRDTVRLKQPETAVVDPGLRQALALVSAGDDAQARRIVGKLLAKEKTADRLRVAGELDERLGNAVAAVNEFEQAVHVEGSEENYFAWGSELLLHRAIWQAKDVFTAGAQRYPKSAQMLTALGAALFACALYDDAAQKLCEAADLNPESEGPYLFLGKVEMASPNPLRCTEEKLDKFVKLRPDNPLASYYDAMAIWKQNGRSTDPQILGQVEALLNRAVALDSRCGDAYLQLGNLNAMRHDDAAAIANYTRAIAAKPELAEAHYRLGLAYDRVGEKEKAKREFAIHEELDKQQAAEVERQRRQVKQFLVKGSGAESSNP